MQSQLDEVARGLITAFAETDGSGGPLPARAGLFTWPGAPGHCPPPARSSTGWPARSRSTRPSIPSAGGNPNLLRDGGANGAGYVHNTGGGASYADLLISYSKSSTSR